MHVKRKYNYKSTKNACVNVSFHLQIQMAGGQIIMKIIVFETLSTVWNH